MMGNETLKCTGVLLWELMKLYDNNNRKINTLGWNEVRVTGMVDVIGYDECEIKC